MKKKSGAIFFRGFMKSCLYLGAFVIIFLASYELTGVYLKHKNAGSAAEDGIKMELQGSVTPVAYNLLFELDETSDELQHVVLEILNTRNNCLMYMTIPMNAKLTMSSEFYQQLNEKSTDVPQILTFDSFKEYIEPAEYYDFGTNLIEDALAVDISYYTIVPADIFEDIFTEEDGCLKLSDSVNNTVAGYSEQSIITYLTDFYKNTKSNLSLDNRLTYTPALSKVNLDDIIYGVIPGESDGTKYEIDLEKTAAIWNAMNQDYVVEEIEALLGTAEQVSLEKNISVLNGSGITGLAAEVKQKLEEAGYTVTGIANYSSSDVQDTIIQVREEGLGTDLISYLHSATVEVNGDMPYGVDIQIILGKSESVS